MKLISLLIDDLRTWKRLTFTGSEWAMLYGFSAGVVPAVSGMLAIGGLVTLLGMLDGKFDFAGLLPTLAFGALVPLLFGFIPASIAFLVLRLLSEATMYVNLQLTLIVATLGTVIATTMVLGFLHPMGIALDLATPIVTLALWALLRAAGLGTRAPAVAGNPTSPPTTTPR